ncbi:MAG: AAA family ATPase [Rhodanobacteraceae bacterium]|nr:AAA family ATPase [Rhodanobacteraceae bacterium]
MSLLNKLTVNGFKSIESCELELQRLNVVIGPNGAGKSNLIGVFRFLNSVLSKQLQLYVGEHGGPDRLLHHGEKTTPKMSFRFDFGYNAYSFCLKPAVGDTMVFDWETIYFHDTRYPRPWNLQIGAGHKETALHDTANTSGSGRRVAEHVLQGVQNWVVYHFHDTSDSAPFKKTQDIDDNRAFRPDAANLAAFLYWMKLNHPTEYRHIVEHVQLVAPFFEDFVLEPSRNNPNKIKLEWQQKESEAYFDAFSLSDGTLRFICLAVLLLQPTLPSLILLDEPELGLHPFAITILAEMVEAAARRSQVMLATQSVTLLNQFSPEAIIIANNDGLHTNFRRLTEQDLSNWMNDYSVGDLWEKNVIGGRP